MKVQDLLIQKGTIVHCTTPESTIASCLDQLSTKRIGALIVFDHEGNIRGIISERDILRTTLTSREKVFEMKVEELMTPREKLITATEEEEVTHVMEIMTEKRLRHLPIVEDEKVVGIISIGDVVKGILHETLEHNKQMQEYIYGR